MRKFGFNFECSFAKTGKIEQVNFTNFFVSKFLDDKICSETDDFVLILDGIVLNKQFLQEKYTRQNWQETVVYMYRHKGDVFFSEFRGTFAGVLYDKLAQKVIVFSDQIGSRFLYYTKIGDSFFVSTLMEEAYHYRVSCNSKNTLSVDSSYLLLSYGFMIEDRTLCEDIKKLKPGCYITIKDEIIKETRYYLLDNTPNNKYTESEWIECIDETFRNAVRQQFDKDIEYGYKHLVALSAGLDSRMTCWVAHEMGYEKQLNYTFSQSGYLDETVPQQITNDLKHEWLYKSLDNGLWLYNLEDITRLTGGNVLYYGLSHAYSMFSNMCFDDYGLIHTGQLGDVILGTFNSTENEKEQFKWGDGAYSRSMLQKIEEMDPPKYKNQEIAKLYLRGFTGTNNGNMAEYAFTDSFSPFYNLDFFELAMSIPLKYRYGHRIYKKWIIQKYPNAAEYVWENLGCKITRKIGIINIGGKKIRIEALPNKVIRKYFPRFVKPSSQSMNPLDYYVSNNKELNEFLSSFTIYADKIDNRELRKDVLSMCKSPSGVERIEAASLLAAIKLYY